ncbi:MAG TPA: prephenate dehydrogenase [Alphaproteobacteria bacterium]|nr:prephenate dehydrogenase [Alphaproteobacteria bacterium]
MKDTLGIIGVGAFGELAVKHLAPHFDLVFYDPNRDLSSLACEHGGRVGNIEDAAGCKIVLLAVPVQRMQQVLIEIAPLVRKDAIVVDVASVKIRPVEMMRELLPSTVQIVGTHPLFGPQSGKNGIAGLNIVVCPVRGDVAGTVRRFCREQLGLQVFQTTAEAHDQEMAYVQGLTHLLSKVVVELNLPAHRFRTKTYCLMQQMVGMVRYDSDELFRAIERENPYAAEAKRSFFAAARRVEKKLTQG